jgi:hypothetical protein
MRSTWRNASLALAHRLDLAMEVGGGAGFTNVQSCVVANWRKDTTLLLHFNKCVLEPSEGRQPTTLAGWCKSDVL